MDRKGSPDSPPRADCRRVIRAELGAWDYSVNRTLQITAKLPTIPGPTNHITKRFRVVESIARVRMGIMPADCHKAKNTPRVWVSVSMELGAGNFPGSALEVAVVEVYPAHGTTTARLSFACPAVSSRIWLVRDGSGIAPDHGERRNWTVFVSGFHGIRRGEFCRISRFRDPPNLPGIATANQTTANCRTKSVPRCPGCGHPRISIG